MNYRDQEVCESCGKSFGYEDVHIGDSVTLCKPCAAQLASEEGRS